MTFLRPLHFSQLKHIALSARNYLWHAENPSDSASKRKGRAVHSYLLGSGAAVVECPIPRNEKHAAYQDFMMRHAGKEILSPSEFLEANMMRRALEEHPRAMELLEGEREVTRDWQWCGVDCQGTPDVVRGEHITELKTSKTAHPEWFPREATRYGYHAQLAWYLISVVGELDPKEHDGGDSIVVVENKPPYHVTVFDVMPADLEAGRKCIRLWIEKLLNCERSGRFPGYVEGSVPLGIGEEFDLATEELSDDE